MFRGRRRPSVTAASWFVQLHMLTQNDKCPAKPCSGAAPGRVEEMRTYIYPVLELKESFRREKGGEGVVSVPPAGLCKRKS
jgi:hypothetical protein